MSECKWIVLLSGTASELRIALRSGIARRIRPRSTLREIRRLKISSLSETGLLPRAVIRLRRPAIFAKLRDLRIGLLPPLIKSAPLFRRSRLPQCRSARLIFTPRAIGSRSAVAIAIRLPRTRRLAFANLRTPRFAFAGLHADGAHFIGSDPAVAVAIETAEDVCGLAEFGGINHAVMICVERVEKTGHRTLHVAAWFAFALLRALALLAGRTFGSAGRARGILRGIFLCSERPRGKRERHRGGKCLVCFHGIGGFALRLNRPRGFATGESVNPRAAEVLRTIGTEPNGETAPDIPQWLCLAPRRFLLRLAHK